MARPKDIHGGDIWQASRAKGSSPEELLDFSASINPLGFPASARRALAKAVKSISPYPDPSSTGLKEAAAAFHSIGIDEVVPANGSNELISVIPRLLRDGPALIVDPAFSEYKKALGLYGIKVKAHILREEDGFKLNSTKLKRAMEGCTAVYIANPSNPAGVLTEKKELLDIMSHARRKCLVIIDEAFADFTGVSVIPEAVKAGNVIVLRSMTKFYAMAGLRLGYAVGAKKLMERLQSFIPAWSVNTLASSAGVAALKDMAFRKRTLTWFETERRFLFSGLASIKGLAPFESSANYIMVKLEEGVDARGLRRALFEKNGMLIRELSAFPGLGPEFFRVAVLGRDANKKLISALRVFLGQR